MADRVGISEKDTHDVKEVTIPYVVTFDRWGAKLPHDYWPSVWRKNGADYLNSEKIHKTVS